MFSHSVSLSISSLRKLDEEINSTILVVDFIMQLFLTRCYVEHAFRPLIDSEINQIRHTFRIVFIIKECENIELHGTYL